MGIKTQLSHVLRHEDLCGTRQMDFIRAEQRLLLQVTLLQALTEYTTLHKSILHHTTAQPYLFSLPACLGLKSQLKTSLFCPCLLIVFSLFPSPFAAVFKLSCVRVQFARVDVRENKVALCYVLECFALQPPSPFTPGSYRTLATDLRNSRIHPHAQKSFQNER